MKRNAKEIFDVIINDPLTVDQRMFLERLGQDARKVVPVSVEDLNEDCPVVGLVDRDYTDVTSSKRGVVNFKITKKGKEFLNEQL